MLLYWENHKFPDSPEEKSDKWDKWLSKFKQFYSGKLLIRTKYERKYNDLTEPGLRVQAIGWSKLRLMMIFGQKIVSQVLSLG